MGPSSWEMTMTLPVCPNFMLLLPLAPSPESVDLTLKSPKQPSKGHVVEFLDCCFLCSLKQRVRVVPRAMSMFVRTGTLPDSLQRLMFHVDRFMGSVITGVIPLDDSRNTDNISDKNYCFSL